MKNLKLTGYIPIYAFTFIDILSSFTGGGSKQYVSFSNLN